MILGAQLYTLREYCKNQEALEETLKKVADMGITAVQFSGFSDYDPERSNKVCKELGLTVVLTHNGFDKISADPKAMMEHHKKLGCKNIGIGTMPGWEINDEKFDKFKNDAKPIVNELADNGFQFMYHNHNIEYLQSVEKKGKRFIDRLFEEFDPRELNITYDTYWGQHAGADPAEEIRRLQGHIKIVHFKDMIAYSKPETPGAVEHRIAAIGEGNMNYPSIIKACLDTGIEYGLIELDDCYGADPFDALKRSYEYLKKFNLK